MLSQGETNSPERFPGHRARRAAARARAGAGAADHARRARAAHRSAQEHGLAPRRRARAQRARAARLGARRDPPGPGACCASRSAASTTPISSSSPIPCCSTLAAESGETINLAVPARPGVEPPRAGRLAPHDRRGQLGRPRGAVPRRRPTARSSSPSAPPSCRRGELDALHAAHDHRPRAPRRPRSTRSARSATRRRSTRSRSVSRPSPRPCAAPTGACVAALSISGPSFRLGPSQLDHMGALLVEQAAVLSTRLGYPTLERG